MHPSLSFSPAKEDKLPYRAYLRCALAILIERACGGHPLIIQTTVSHKLHGGSQYRSLNFTGHRKPGSQYRDVNISVGRPSHTNTPWSTCR